MPGADDPTRYVYDDLNRRTHEFQPTPDGSAGDGPETRRDYDAVGNLVAMTDPVGRMTTYGYDKLNSPDVRVAGRSRWQRADVRTAHHVCV